MEVLFAKLAINIMGSENEESQGAESFTLVLDRKKTTNI